MGHLADIGNILHIFLKIKIFTQIDFSRYLASMGPKIGTNDLCGGVSKRYLQKFKILIF